jgi:hypothetical protein
MLIGFAGKQAKDCAWWNESAVSVCARAEKQIEELKKALRSMIDLLYDAGDFHDDVVDAARKVLKDGA